MSLHTHKRQEVIASTVPSDTIQQLSQMTATKTETILFASCLSESMIISLLDFSQTMWKSVWSLARELYADASITKPMSLHGETMKIKEELK